MADIKITADAKQAINQVRFLKGEYTRLKKAAEAKRRGPSVEDNVKLAALALVKAEKFAKAVAETVDVINRRSKVWKESVKGLTPTLSKLRSDFGNLNKAELATFEDILIKVEKQFTNTTKDSQTLFRVIEDLRKGTFRWSKAYGLTEKELASVHKIATNLLGLEDRRDRRIADQNKKLTKQKELAAAVQRKRQMGRQGAGFVQQAFGPMKDVKGTSQEEAQAYRTSVQNLKRLAKQHGVSYNRMERLVKVYSRGVRVMSDSRNNAVLRGLAQQEKAEKRLGATARREAAAAARAYGKVRKSASTSYNAVEKSGRAMLISWKSFARLLVIQQLHVVIGRITSAVFEANREMIEFQRRISEIRTIAQDAQLSFDDWSNSILNLSAKFPQRPEEVGAAAYQALSNQVAKGREVIGFLNEELLFSVTTMTKVSDAVNLTSAALNAYNLDVVNAEAVNAQFFKTIELGRVRGEELANTYGRVAPQAAQLNVPMEELNALLAQTTIRGLKYDEAMTLINNVMQKMIRPTDRMKELLGEWGVTSGEAAFRTFGLVGVFQKLEQEAGKGGDRLAELGELFSRLRSIRGGSMFTDPEFLEQLPQTIDEIRNSVASYQQATELAQESPAFKIQQEFEALRASALKLFSGPMISGFAKLIEDSGGLINMLRPMTGLVAGIVGPLLHALPLIIKNFKLVVAVTIALSVKTKILSAVTGIASSRLLVYNARALRLHGTLGLLRFNIIRAGAALKALAGPAIIMGLVTLVGYLVQAKMEAAQLAREMKQNLVEALAAVKEGVDETAALDKNSLESRRGDLQDHLKETIQLYSGHIAKIRQLFNVLQSSSENTFRRALDTFRDSLKATSSDISDLLNKVSTKIKAVESILTKLKKDQFSKKFRSDEDIFQLGIKNKSEQAQLKAVLARAEEQKKLAEKILKEQVLNTDDPDLDPTLGMQRYESVLQNIRQQLDKAASLEDQLYGNRAQGQIQRLTDLQNLRADAEQRVNDAMKERKGLLEADKAKITELKKNFEEQKATLDQFQVSRDDRSLLEEQGKALKGTLKEMLEAGAMSPERYDAQVAATDALVTSLKEQSALAEAMTQLGKQQEKLIDSEKILAEQIQSATDNEAKGVQIQKAAVENMRNLTTNLRAQFLERFEGRGTRIRGFAGQTVDQLTAANRAKLLKGTSFKSIEDIGLQYRADTTVGGSRGADPNAAPAAYLTGIDKVFDNFEAAVAEFKAEPDNAAAKQAVMDFLKVFSKLSSGTVGGRGSGVVVEGSHGVAAKTETDFISAAFDQMSKFTEAESLVAQAIEDQGKTRQAITDLKEAIKETISDTALNKVDAANLKRDSLLGEILDAIQKLDATKVPGSTRPEPTADAGGGGGNSYGDLVLNINGDGLDSGGIADEVIRKIKTEGARDAGFFNFPTRGLA